MPNVVEIAKSAAEIAEQVPGVKGAAGRALEEVINFGRNLIGRGEPTARVTDFQLSSEMLDELPQGLRSARLPIGKPVEFSDGTKLLATDDNLLGFVGPNGHVNVSNLDGTLQGRFATADGRVAQQGDSILDSVRDFRPPSDKIGSVDGMVADSIQRRSVYGELGDWTEYHMQFKRPDAEASPLFVSAEQGGPVKPPVRFFEGRPEDSAAGKVFSYEDIAARSDVPANHSLSNSIARIDQIQGRMRSIARMLDGSVW